MNKQEEIVLVNVRLLYCPHCGSEVKTVFDTVKAGDPYPEDYQMARYVCPDCKASTLFLPKRYPQKVGDQA